MTRFIILCIFLFSLVAGSCSSRKNKVDNTNMIPEKEFISLLSDLYMTDGILSLAGSSSFYTPNDTLSAQLDVFNKHGYTKEDMDRTIMYYYIKKPKELVKIYDEVLGGFSEMESRFSKEANILQTKLSNLWPGDDVYYLPDPSGNDSANINLNQQTTGAFVLTFTATLSAVDESFNPRATIYTCHPDSLLTGKRHYTKTPLYIKDGRPHNYSLDIYTSNEVNFHVRGWFYDSESRPDDSGISLKVENIFLAFNPGYR